MPWHKTLTVEKTRILQPAVFQDCLVMASTAQINTETKSVWGKRFASSSTSIAEEARVGTKAGPWRRTEAETVSIAAYCLVPRVFFSLPSYTIQDHLHRVALPRGLGNSTSIINQENKSVLRKHFYQLRSPLPRYIQVWVKLEKNNETKPAHDLTQF